MYGGAMQNTPPAFSTQEIWETELIEYGGLTNPLAEKEKIDYTLVRIRIIRWAVSSLSERRWRL